MHKSKFHGAFVLNRRVYLHAIDATPARWRGDVGSSPLDGASAVHPTHWLISTQVAIEENESSQSLPELDDEAPFEFCLLYTSPSPRD